MTNQPTTRDFINHALTCTLTDIGQLDGPTRSALNRLVKKGILSKGKGGPFPAIKTVYAVAGFDFAAHRQQHIDHMVRLSEMDRAARIARNAR
jgi:hypothetical protein